MPEITIPTDAAELEEMLSDSSRMQTVFKDQAAFGDFVRNYAKANAKADPDIGQQVREQVQLVLAETLKENGAVKTPVNLAPGSPSPAKYGKGALYNRKAPGVALDTEFEDTADYFRAIWHHSGTLSDGAARQAKLDRVRQVQNSFGSAVPDAGGFLIPEVLRSQILQTSLETAIVRPLATVLPMESLRVPIPTIDSTSNASSVFGGIVAYWTEEAAQLTESQATFGRVVLDAKKLTAYAEVPNELVADASAFGAFFDQLFPQAIAWYEDVAFMKGSGAGEPLGFIGCAATATVTAETAQPTATIVWENVAKMYARMLPASLNNAVWIASPDTFPQLATMALSVGTGGSAVWLNNGAAGPPMTILGRPVIFTEKANTLGTAGDLSFVDLSYYLIGDRQAMSATSSPHYKFQNDKTAFRIIERLDGRPWLQSAITPQNGGPTLSPFVNLATRP